MKKIILARLAFEIPVSHIPPGGLEEMFDKILDLYPQASYKYSDTIEAYNTPKNKIGFNTIHKQIEHYFKSSNEWDENSWTPIDQYYDKIKVSLERALNELNRRDLNTINIGSYKGKWTDLLIPYSNKITSVDLNDKYFNYIKERFIISLGDTELDFYVTKGDELNGISSQSQDLIFSMDSLVRCSYDQLCKYFEEFSRVLKKDGLMYIHINQGITPSPFWPFPYISQEQLADLCLSNGFDYEITDDLLKSGSVLVAKKSEHVII